MNRPKEKRPVATRRALLLPRLPYYYFFFFFFFFFVVVVLAIGSTLVREGCAASSCSGHG